MNPLNDTHKQLMVHWVGDKSKVIICLARDAAPLIPGNCCYKIYDNSKTYILCYCGSPVNDTTTGLVPVDRLTLSSIPTSFFCF